MVRLLLSALNMFSIPFYCWVTTTLDVAGWLQFSQQNILTIVVGSTIGSFALLYMYVNYVKIIQWKSKKLAKQLNLILSILIGAIALITLVNILSI